MRLFYSIPPRNAKRRFPGLREHSSFPMTEVFCRVKEMYIQSHLIWRKVWIFLPGMYLFPHIQSARAITFHLLSPKWVIQTLPNSSSIFGALIFWAKHSVSWDECRFLYSLELCAPNERRCCKNVLHLQNEAYMRIPVTQFWNTGKYASSLIFSDVGNPPYSGVWSKAEIFKLVRDCSLDSRALRWLSTTIQFYRKRKTLDAIRITQFSIPIADSSDRFRERHSQYTLLQPWPWLPVYFSLQKILGKSSERKIPRTDNAGIPTEGSVVLGLGPFGI